MTWPQFWHFLIFQFLTISGNSWKTQQFLTILTIASAILTIDKTMTFETFNLAKFNKPDTLSKWHGTCDIWHVCDMWHGQHSQFLSWFYNTPHKDCAPRQTPQPHRALHRPLHPLHDHHQCHQHHGRPHPPLLPSSPKKHLNKVNHKIFFKPVPWS